MGKQFNSSSLNSNMKCVIAFVTMAMAATADTVEVMVDTAMVDTVAREKLNHTMDTEVMVVTVAREKLKLPQLHTMVDTEDTDMVDTEDTLTASKRSIIYNIPRLIATPFNL